MIALCCPKIPTVYRPRKPEKTVLHRIVKEHYKPWSRKRELPLPFHIQREFHSFLQCGILANGFAHACCSGCQKEYLIGFSCKGRGLCPSCNQRSMVEVGVHLVQSLIPAIPIRQWVISFPKRLRCYLDDSSTMQRVLRAVTKEIQRCILHFSPDVPGAQFAAISFIQRFGNTLNYHPHIHFLAADGVFADNGSGGVTFHAGLIPSEIIPEVEEAIRKRVLKVLQRRKLLTKFDVETMLSYEHGGFSLNAAVRVESQDNDALERLVRYCARPAFVSENLSIRGGCIVYRFPKIAHNGMRQIQLPPEDFLERIAAFVPAPMKHRRHYHGAFASKAPLRALIVDLARKKFELPKIVKKTAKKISQVSETWRELIRYIYEVDPLLCDSCGGKIKILGFITNSESIHRILTRLGWPTEKPIFNEIDSIDSQNDFQTYLWNGKPIINSEEIDPIKLEYLEYCRRESLHDAHHDPPETVDPPHAEDYIDPPHEEEIFFVYD